MITKFSIDEWQKYRDIGLLALKTDPLAFCSSYEQESTLSELKWRYRIDAMWFAKDKDQVIGMVRFLINGWRLSSSK